MKQHGQIKWIPRYLLQELECIKTEKQIQRDSEAFKRIVDYCRVGREVEKIRDKFTLQDVFSSKGTNIKKQRYSSKNMFFDFNGGVL